MICFDSDFFPHLRIYAFFSVLRSCFHKSMYALWLSMMPEIVLFISHYPSITKCFFGR